MASKNQNLERYLYGFINHFMVDEVKYCKFIIFKFSKVGFIQKYFCILFTFMIGIKISFEFNTPSSVKIIQISLKLNKSKQ